jgi:hypothetical protein
LIVLQAIFRYTFLLLARLYTESSSSNPCNQSPLNHKVLHYKSNLQVLLWSVFSYSLQLNLSSYQIKLIPF